MARQIRNEYNPDAVSPPGETLQDTLEAIGMSQAELARRSGRPVKTINEIIKGKAGLTPDTALQLERVLGIPARFWSRREELYRGYLVRQAEARRLRKELDWLKEVPWRDMARKGWIKQCKDEVEQVTQLLQFFGVTSPVQWHELWTATQVAFRKSSSFEAQVGAVAAWLRKGELTAQDIPTAPYAAAVLRGKLDEIRALTLLPFNRAQPLLVALCAEAGVALVSVPELPGTRASGASRWLTPTKALIQLSFRYRTEDHLWFTFFHEAGHILLHAKKPIFLDRDLAKTKPDEEEDAANRFASDILIPPNALASLRRPRRPSEHTIRAFARDVGIAPGIVVGRLQHEGLLPFSHLSDLKRKVTWAGN